MLIRTTSTVSRLLATALCALSVGLAAHAKTVSLGGPLQRGHGRPPIHLNLTPSTSTSYTPAQIRHAYGFDQITGTGAGQRIAIVDAYGSLTAQSDLNTFCTQFGLPQTTLQIIGTPSTNNNSWALETALDVQWAHAIAPDATIILCIAPSSGIIDLLNSVDAAVHAGATAVSMSWGAGEFGSEGSYDSHFNIPGVTFLASSGDSGAGVEWPAASPYVVGVGGTSLYLDSSNNRTSETAWSGSGGGISGVYARPSYQTGWTTASGRAVPDVSLVADPNTGVYVYSGGSWYVVGGTSASAPQWAGLVALCNEMRSAGPLNAANSVIYPTAAASTTTPYTVNSTYFFDVISGSNGYNATPSYDLVTGIGSPKANQLIPALAGSTPPPPPPADFGLSVSPSSRSVKQGRGTTYSVSISALNGFASAVNLTVSGVPTNASASFSPASVNTSGYSTLSVTTTRSTKTGNYTLRITGTSGTLQHSANVTLSVK